jgi:hypothetical protein
MTAVALLLAAPAASGCFEIQHGASKTVDDVTKSEPKIVPRAQIVAKIEQEGSKLSVSAHPTCALVEMQDIEHTTKTEKKFDGGVTGGLVAMGILGAVPLTGGIVMLADSPKVFDSSHDARTYNPTGRGAAVALGTVLTAIGTVSVAVPIVNAGRVAGSETSTSSERREGKTLRPNVACDGTAPATSYSVMIQAAGGQSVSLGATDAQGHLSADLKISLAPWLTTPVPPVSAGIYVNNQFVGEVALDDVYRELQSDRAKQDELTWSQVDAGPCAQLHTEPACAKVRAYVAAFPSGKHADDARGLLGALAQQAPVVAENVAAERLGRAVAAAQQAQTLAANKVRERAEKEHQKALLKAEEDALKAGKSACEASCKKVCDEPSSGKQKLTAAESSACRTTCVEEVCP